MCGIVGILSSRAPVDQRRVLAMRETLRHRGPDDAGFWGSPDGQVGLGHRRLSILDLSEAGHQPMADPAGRVAVVYNGEVYNVLELREELQARGVRFRSHCDTEVLLQAYLAWGEECLSRLDGMFAFALWDAERRTLLAARDRAGEKPFFYHHSGGALRFGSELKALLADRDLPRRLDPQALNHYLAFGYVPGSRSMLAGFAKLPPGCLLRYRPDEDRLEVRRYWSLPAAEPPHEADADALAERLEELLVTSVKRRLLADVPVGILLSGGVDSSLVTAAAAQAAPGTVRTFTITFPGHGRYDEGPYARAVAEHFGTEHTELPAEPASVELLPELARQVDEPMADSSLIPTYLVSRLIRHHATVALGGDGGDELFGGYPGHGWVQRMARQRRFLPRPVRELARSGLSRALPAGLFGRNYLLGLLADLPGSCVQINLFFDPLHRARLLRPLAGKPGRAGLDAPERAKLALQAGRTSALQRMTALDFGSYLPEDILVKVDRASMLTSLEVRAPFLDPAIIDFAFQAVPDALRATAGETKILPRRLAGRLLPTSLDLQRKQGFSLPLEAWFRGRWGAFCREVLLDAPGDVFDREMVHRLLAGQRGGRRHTQRLFAMTMFELWRAEYEVTVG